MISETSLPMNRISENRFGEMLVHEGVITREQLKLALERQVVSGGRVGTNLMELGILGDDVLSHYLGKYYGMPSVKREELMNITPEVLGIVPSHVADRLSIIPFKKDGDTLHVALMDSENVSELNELEIMTGYKIVPHITTESRLIDALARYYGIKKDIKYLNIFDKDSLKVRKASVNRIKKVKTDLIKARNNKEVGEILVSESAKVVSRVALFNVRKGYLKVWIAKGMDIEGMQIPFSGASICAEVIMRRLYFRGPIPDTPENDKLFEALGGKPLDSLIIPIWLKQQINWILYGDNGVDQVLTSNLNYMHKLVTVSALAFEIQALKKIILDL